MFFTIQPRHLRHIPILLIALIAAAVAEAQGVGQVNGQPLIRFSASAAEPIIEYRLVHQLLSTQDTEPLLRIYGDGRAHVHYPAYMKKAGDYEYQLSRPELNALLRSLSQDGVIDFDHAAVETERKLLKDQLHATGVLHHISDATETVINIRLDEYQRNPAVNRVRGLNKRLTWENLEQDARYFPQSNALRGAANGAQRLHGLLDHPDMQQVK